MHPRSRRGLNDVKSKLWINEYKKEMRVYSHHILFLTNETCLGLFAQLDYLRRKDQSLDQQDNSPCWQKSSQPIQRGTARCQYYETSSALSLFIRDMHLHTWTYPVVMTPVTIPLLFLKYLNPLTIGELYERPIPMPTIPWERQITKNWEKWTAIKHAVWTRTSLGTAPNSKLTCNKMISKFQMISSQLLCSKSFGDRSFSPAGRLDTCILIAQEILQCIHAVFYDMWQLDQIVPNRMLRKVWCSPTWSAERRREVEKSNRH